LVSFAEDSTEALQATGEKKWLLVAIYDVAINFSIEGHHFSK